MGLKIHAKDWKGKVVFAEENRSQRGKVFGVGEQIDGQAFVIDLGEYG